MTADLDGAPAASDELPTGPDRAPRPPAVGCLIELGETLVLTLIIFWVIQSFVAQPFKVEMELMEGTLLPDQYVLVDKVTPAWDTYKRGDIVVFRPPATWVRSRGEPYIKRVIGVGGDTVEIHDGAVFVNGTELVEPYVFQEDGGPGPTTTFSGIDRWVIPAGQLFLLGDHRENSSDSRRGRPDRRLGGDRPGVVALLAHRDVLRARDAPPPGAATPAP